MTAVEALAKAAARLGRTQRRRKRGRIVPTLFFLTDPERTPDPAPAMLALPKGSAVIFRAFGRPDALEEGKRLRALARRRGLVFLVGADARLAAALDADGLHLPERSLFLARSLRQRRPLWLITGAAHSPRALASAARLKLDAALYSAVFASDSPSAPSPVGPRRFAAHARAARLPVVALGGVNARTARLVASSGAHGLAAIGGLVAPAART